MSSILKALKKIDDAPRPAEDDPPWPQPQDAQDTITAGIKKRWLRRRLLTYALVAACLMTLVVVLYLRQNERKEQRQAAAPNKTIAAGKPLVHRAKIARTAPQGGQPKTAKPKKMTLVPLPAPARKTISPTKKQAPGRVQTLPMPPDTSARNNSRVAEPRKPLPKRSKKAATKIQTPVPESAKSTSASTGSRESTKTAPQSKPKPSYNQLENSDLTLQAIAWSPQPDKRIAVINGSIVREGESVDGFTLMRIRTDDVVLNDGAKSWQLDFGLQQ